MDDIARTVKDYILKEFLPGESPDELTQTTPLISGGIIDSIATMKLVRFLENEYSIEIEPHELGGDNLETLDAISRFVGSKRGGK